MFRLGAHSTESKKEIEKEIEKYSWDKGPPSNYISQVSCCPESSLGVLTSGR